MLAAKPSSAEHLRSHSLEPRKERTSWSRTAMSYRCLGTGLSSLPENAVLAGEGRRRSSQGAWLHPAGPAEATARLTGEGLRGAQ